MATAAILTEQTLFRQEQAATFERQADGPEQAAERMARAAKALARGCHAFTDMLHKSSALNDAGVVFDLARQPERLAARAQMRLSVKLRGGW